MMKLKLITQKDPNNNYGMSEPISKPIAKTKAVADLLNTIEITDLIAVCHSLGWKQSNVEKEPQLKHFIVAIIDMLIKTAKANDWHIINHTGFFYIFNGAYWVVLENDEVKHLLKDAAIRMGYTVIESRNNSFVDKLFRQAKQDGFFVDRNYVKQSIINLRNGSLVLSEEGIKLKAFDYRDFLTYQLDFEFDEKATNKLFLEYLDKVLPDSDTRRTLQQVAGYLFVKGLKMEKIFFLYGLGANGKSVFFEVLSGVIGKENISNFSLESLTDSNGYHRAKIKDKLVNYGTDIRLTKIDAGMFKTLASGEPIEARLPYQEPFLMGDYAKLIFNVNKMESANIEHTHGFTRRLLIIPFTQTIPKAQQDRDLHKKILANPAGVLNWIIEGAEEVIRNRDIFISDECHQFKAQLLKEADSVAMFEEDIREKLKNATYSKTVTDSYRDYKAYCHEVGYKKLGRGGFSKRMETLGFVKNKVSVGITLEKNYS